jgi:hypothetical protein
MARFDRYNTPSIFTSLSARNFVGDVANITNVFLTSVQVLSVMNNPIIGLGVVAINYTHTNILTARTATITETIYASGGNSNDWNLAYTVATSVSASFDNLPQVIPTVTNYLTTEPIEIGELNVTQQLLSAGTDLFDIFLTSETDNQTLTFNQTTLDLSILSGNTVNLSGINSVFAQSSGKYEVVASIVASNSASWEESDLILPTTTNYLSTNLVTISALAVTNLDVRDVSNFNTVTFAAADTGKIIHINTSVTPEVTINFTASLPEGFNIGVVNTGTGVIYIDSDYTPVIRAKNPFNSTQHTGMFIYKTNNQLYGIGVFE